MEEWGSVMTSNIFSNGAARRIELLADVQRRLASSSESLEQVRSYAITMLHYACQAGDVAMVHLVLLLCRGVDVNGRNVWGGTPLHSLCRYGHLKAQALNMREIALMFVMHGADLDLRDNYKKTPHDYAVQNQIFEVSDVLSAIGSSSSPAQDHHDPIPTPTSVQMPPRSLPATAPLGSVSPPPLPTYSAPPSLPPVQSVPSPQPLTTATPSMPATSLPPVSPPPMSPPPLVPLASTTNPLLSTTQPGSNMRDSNEWAASAHQAHQEAYRAPYSAPPLQQVQSPSSPVPDIRELGLDPGPGEDERKSSKKKKNNTILRHVNMIHESPKPPYGGGRTSRPNSAKQSSSGKRPG